MAENKRHKGHRQRMRERVQSYGLDSLAGTRRWNMCFT